MKKVLIIEDEELMYSVLEKRLSREGYDVVVAHDGEEGLEMAQQEKPDLVLLDIVMPKKNGFEVLETMQKDEELRNIPVIIISNSGQPVEIDRAQELGARDWLIKTEFDPKEVLEKVRNQIG